ncbi:MAG: trigger factor [Candidatus Cloacimonetes bacterium]|nr:trigger factor [Candidatus Cloacimonadota bacterium]MBL7086480.1 trigger factor [Candidatus Cloacimonadota bacterium]
MKIDLKKLADCKRKLTITIPNEIVDQDYQTTVRKYRNYLSIPGFRKGKAPLSMVENKYKEQIKTDYLDEYLPKYYKNAILKLEKDNIFPVSQGTMEDSVWSPGKELNASFILEVSPSIELKKYKNFEINFEPEKATPQMIDNELKALQNNYAKVIDKDSPAENQDLIYYKMEKYGGEQLKEKKESSYIIGNKIFGEKFDKAVLGTKIDDIINTVFEIPSSKQNEKPKIKNVVLKISSVKKIEMPKLNDEFAKDVGDYKTLEELKNEIKKGLEVQIRIRNDREKTSLILQEIIKLNPFEVPKSFIENYISEMIKKDKYKEKNISQENLEKMKMIYRKNAVKELKIFYILQKLREIENVEVSDKEIENEIKKSAERLSMDVDKYKKLYEKQINKEEIKISIMNDKILKNISSTVKLTKNK